MEKLRLLKSHLKYWKGRLAADLTRQEEILLNELHGLDKLEIEGP